MNSISNNDTPADKLVAVIKGADLAQLTVEFGEIAIDSSMDEGMLRDIPVVGSIVGLVKFGNSINRMLMTKKVYSFLYQLHDIPEKDRETALEKIRASSKYRSHVGESVFEILEKIDSEGKPEILGKIFAAVVEERISYMDFLRCASLVKTVFYYDLVELRDHCDGVKVVGLQIRDTIAGLTSTDYAALMNLDEASAGSSGSQDSRTTLTDLGEIIINIGMR